MVNRVFEHAGYPAVVFGCEFEIERRQQGYGMGEFAVERFVCFHSFMCLADHLTGQQTRQRVALQPPKCV